ncbi:hypothetical protein ACFQFH_14870 [Halobaculum halobium]|uniref:Uncharacterized protein n=1 Tax=Halobaculum halobium TaxID=3032281 RepID=A0ABD5TCS3_9EURY|nr:hypothetical protein [Halobaculum sp. SYNS20]
MVFYDRVDEFAALEEAFESPGHDCFVVYGRRARLTIRAPQPT